LKSLIAYNSIVSGRAKRGTSGALYPRAAIAGLKSDSRFCFFGTVPVKVVMKAGSCAAEGYKPRQVRKEAAVSSCLRVP